MFDNKFSRRFFLQGASASLALPLLPSIMPFARAQATNPPKRYIQIISTYGQLAKEFYPNGSNMAQVGSGIVAKDLSAISGNLSHVLGPDWNALKNKMSVVTGLHVFAGSQMHNGCQPTCASGTPEDNYHRGRPVFSYSIDDVLSKSSKVYPNPAGKHRHINVCPQETGQWNNYSWTKINGNKQLLPRSTSTEALLTKIVQFNQPIVNNNTSTVDLIAQKKLDVVNVVFEDYKRLRNSGKLSSEDKIRLENYMGMIEVVQRDLAAANTGNPPPTSSCKNPVTISENNNGHLMHQNQSNILAIAMACDFTRVASYVISPYISQSKMHAYSHNPARNGGADGVNQAKAHKESHIDAANFIKLLDSIADVDGKSLLDNSVIYMGNEYGEIIPSGANSHSSKDHSAIILGGGGDFNLGKYIDYRPGGGYPLSRLLVSLFNHMGLSSSDYQRDNVIGFGEYDPGMISSFNQQTKTTNTERVLPLPYLYKGVALK